MLYRFCENNHKKRLSHYLSIFLSHFHSAEKQNYSFILFPCTLKIYEIAGVDFPCALSYFPFHQPSPSHKNEWFQGLIFASCTSLLSSPTYPNHVAVALQALHQFPRWDSLELIHSRVFTLSLWVHGPWTSFIFSCFCPWQFWLPVLSKQESSALLERQLTHLLFDSVPPSPSSVHLG